MCWVCVWQGFVHGGRRLQAWVWQGFGRGGRLLLAWPLEEASEKAPTAPSQPHLQPSLSQPAPQQINRVKRGKRFGNGLSFWELAFVLEGVRTARETTREVTQVSKEGLGEALWSCHFPSAHGEMAG